MAANYVHEITTALVELLPTCDHSLLSQYALLVLVKGADTTMEDVHDAWSVWQSRRNPHHSSLVPFDQLAPRVQEMDRKYMLAIHQVAGHAEWRAAA